MSLPPADRLNIHTYEQVSLHLKTLTNLYTKALQMKRNTHQYTRPQYRTIICEQVSKKEKGAGPAWVQLPVHSCSAGLTLTPGSPTVDKSPLCPHEAASGGKTESWSPETGVRSPESQLVSPLSSPCAPPPPHPHSSGLQAPVRIQERLRSTCCLLRPKALHLQRQTPLKTEESRRTRDGPGPGGHMKLVGGLWGQRLHV